MLITYKLAECIFLYFFLHILLFYSFQFVCNYKFDIFLNLEVVFFDHIIHSVNAIFIPEVCNDRYGLVVFCFLGYLGIINHNLGMEDFLVDALVEIVRDSTDEHTLRQRGDFARGYKEHPYDVLHIIDSYFHAEDLYIVKMLMDVNNRLNCSILTCKDVDAHKNESLDDVFQNGWNRWSSELPGRIEVKSCCYRQDQRNAPFHDRWWVLQDTESDEALGLRMASVSTMGNRIAEVSELNDDDIASANKLWTRFFQNMVPKVEGRELDYDEAKLR